MIQIKHRQANGEHSEGHKVIYEIEGKKLESNWFISDSHLTARMKKEPGVKLYSTDEKQKLKAHLHLDTRGEYTLRKYSPPPPAIDTAKGRLEFHEEVEDIDTAQNILDGFRYSGMPAAATHKCGLHQIYVKYKS